MQTEKSYVQKSHSVASREMSTVFKEVFDLKL